MIDFTQDDLNVISKLENVIAFDDYKMILRRLVESETDRVLNKPVIDDKDFKRDIRFRLGGISMLKKIIEGIDK